MKRVAIFMGAILLVLLVVGLLAVPGALVLMFLLWLLSKVSNFPQLALNFWSCYIIVIIIMLFFTRSRGDNW
jgi:hypothetical protein